MINDEADEIIKEFFDSLKNRYQNKNKNATINPINKKDNNCSIHCNSRVKSRRNKKRFAKNNKN